MSKKTHLGKNISRIRTLRNMKQEILARALGTSQQAISKMEQRENIGGEMLQKVAKALNVSPSSIQEFDETTLINEIDVSKNDVINGFNYVNGGCNNGTCQFIGVIDLLKKMIEECHERHKTSKPEI